MDKFDLYKKAIGKRASDYYIEIFKRFEDRNRKIYSCYWNWGALFSGPFWFGYRNFGIYFVIRYTILATLIFVVIEDLFWGTYRIFLLVFLYILLFPIPANYLYWKVVDNYIEKDLANIPDDEKLKAVEHRFQTSLDIKKSRT